jgi:hypothetical protein
MKQSASILFAAVFFLLAGCESGKIDPNLPGTINASANAVNASTKMIDEISTVVRPRPVGDSRTVVNPVDESHSKVIFTNETDRVLSITLEGPRSYELNVGYGGDVEVVVVPGRYTSRFTAPSTKTGSDTYTFKGGVVYEYRFFKPGHEPR